MPEIALPTGLKSTLVRMAGDWVQSVLRSPGGARQALQLAHPAWRGAVVLETEDHATQRRLAAWLFSVGRGDNWSRVPIGKPLAAAPLVATVVSHSVVSGVMRVFINGVTAAGLVDRYFSDGKRLRYVQAAASAGSNAYDLAVVPPTPAQTAGDTMSETDTVRMQLADVANNPSAASDADFGRPVRVEWVEYTL